MTVTEALNSGNALTAGAAYIFSIPVKSGESINLRYSTPVIGATTVANGTGTATGAPITLVAMSTTIVVTGAGNFTVTLAAGTYRHGHIWNCHSGGEPPGSGSRGQRG